MDKFARKKSSDPVQEHLRQEKDNWNKEMSSLISELIQFKKVLNGRGSSILGIQPSSIKDPLPTETGSVLKDISTKYNAVLQKANTIIQEQSNYSQHRRKSTADSEIEELYKLASWWGSRLYSRVGLRQLNQLDRKFRFRLMKSVVELINECKEFESDIVDYKSADKIPLAFTKLNSILISYQGVIISSYNEYKNVTKEQEISEINFIPELEGEAIVEPITKTEPEHEPEVVHVSPPPANKTEEEYILLFSFLEEKREYIKNIFNQLIKSNVNIDENDKQIIKNNLSLFNKRFNQVGMLLKTPSVNKDLIFKELKDLSDIFNILKSFFIKYNDYIINHIDKTFSLETLKQSFNINESIIKTASLDRWVSEKILFLKGDNLSFLRLDTSAVSKQLRELFNDLLNDLENKNSTIDNFSKDLLRINNLFINLIDKMLLLGKKYMLELRRRQKEKNFYLKEIKEADVRSLVQIGRELSKNAFK